MGDTPTTTNQTATEINTVIVGGKNAIVTIVETLTLAQVPWLGWPGIKQLWEWVLVWVLGKAAIAVENGATFAVIDDQIVSENTALSQAYAALKSAQLSGDPDAIEKAIQNYANAHSALVTFDGAAPGK